MDENGYLPEVVHRFMIQVFKGLGTPAEEARICADVLIASDLQGIESHGIGRLKYYYDRIKAGVQSATTKIEIVRETETTAVVDGHHGMGHVIASVSMGSPRSPNGARSKWRPVRKRQCPKVGWWTRRAVPSPIRSASWAIWARPGRLLPLGGKGELLAGYKGYALATMVEILSASLCGGAFMKDLLGIGPDGSRRPFMLGHFFLAIDIEHFIPLEVSKRITGQIMRALQASKPQAVSGCMSLAKEYETERLIRKQGIPVNRNLRRELQIMRDELAIPDYEAFF